MLSGFAPMHPGELLREEVLPGLEMDRSELARRLNVSNEALNAVLAEREPMSAGVADELGEVCGNDDAEIWLTRQNRYDFDWIARADAGEAHGGAR